MPRYRFRRHFPPGAEAGTTNGRDSVVAKRGHPEHVGRGHDVVRIALEIGKRDPFREHGDAGDLQQRRTAADAGAVRWGRGNEPTKLAIA
jgi:hypothetical protein